MIRSVASKVMWVGRATVFLIGLAVILALLLGAASTALGANGEPFLLGKKNVATKVSNLVKSGSGPALRLKVDSGPPLAVNSSSRVARLNADKLDGKDSAQLVTATTPIYQVQVAGQVGDDLSEFVTASCDSGDRLQAGGYLNLSPNASVEDNQGGGGTWTVEINGANATDSVATRIICYDFPPLRE